MGVQQRCFAAVTHDRDDAGSNSGNCCTDCCANRNGDDAGDDRHAELDCGHRSERAGDYQHATGDAGGYHDCSWQRRGDAHATGYT